MKLSINKKALSERDICTKYITPAIVEPGWDVQTQVREEVTLTPGRILVKGRLVSRGATKRADYILYYKPNIPLAVIEAKDNNHNVGSLRSCTWKYECQNPDCVQEESSVRYQVKEETQVFAGK